MSGKLDPRIYVLALATFAGATEANVYAGLLGELAQDFRITLATAGLLAAGFAIAYAATAPILAPLTNHWQRRRVLVWGLGVLGAFNIAAAALPTFGALLASRVLCGLLAALIGPSATAAASLLAPTTLRGRAVSIVGAGTGLAFTVGVPIGSAIGGVFGWRSTFLFAGALLFLCSALLAGLLPNVPKGAQTGLKGLQVLRHRPVLGRLSVTVASFTATFATIAYLGPTAARVAQSHGFGVGLFQACIGAGSIVGVLFGGRLADRAHPNGRLAPLALAIAVTQLMIAGAVAFPGALGKPLLACGIVIGAAALFMIIPIVQIGLVSHAPEQRTTLIALNGTAIFLGQGLGALLGGLTISFWGLSYCGIMGAVIASFLAVALFLLSPIRSTFGASSLTPLDPANRS